MVTVRRLFVALLAAMVCVSSLTVVVTAQTASPVPDTGDLRVMTYNIKHGRGNDDCVNPTVSEGTIPNTECEVDLARTSEVIERSGASIVGLQEVDRYWARSGGVDQPAELSSLLGMNQCYGANLDHPADNHANEPHQYGVAILSDYPIIECTNTLLPTPEGWEQRGALSATIDIGGGQQILVINTHLQAGREGAQEEAARQRAEQLATLLELAEASDLPTIIMGDLNARPGDDELARIVDPTSGFTDVWSAVHGGDGGFTSPASPDAEPEARIDYIFVSAGLQVLGSEVVVDDLTRMASDHFPVVADLRLASPGATPVATPVG